MCGEGVRVNILGSEMDSFTSPTHLTTERESIGDKGRRPTEAAH
jgi:hypothetical protein